MSAPTLTFTPARGSPWRVVDAPVVDVNDGVDAVDGRVVTVLRDIHTRPVGKRFDLVDGRAKKLKVTHPGDYWAQSVHVPTLTALGELIAGFGPDEALILGCIPEAGFEPYRIQPKFAIRGRFGLPDDTDPVGLHTAPDGVRYAARLKENFTGCRYLLLDRDPDGAPPDVAGLSDADYLALLDKALPGIAAAERIVFASSSGRVAYPDGTPALSAGASSHTYIECAGEAWRDLDDLRDRFTQAGEKAGLGWTGVNKAGSVKHELPWDKAVIIAGREIFESAPAVPTGLIVLPRAWSYSPGGQCPAPPPIALVAPQHRRRAASKSGLSAGPESATGDVDDDVDAADDSADTFFGKVNDRAMRTFAHWVPALLPGARRYGSGYRVSSAALNRDCEEDLSIQRNGIKDFGVWDTGDKRQGRRTPIELVCEYRPGNATEAALWLCGRLKVDPAKLGYSADDDAESDDDEGPESTAAELCDESDFLGDCKKLKDCHPAQARNTARKILTRYAAQCPRKRSFTAMADEVIASLPTGCNPALPRGLHSFTEWLERQARMRAVRSSSIEQGQLRNAGIEYRTVADLNGLAVAIAADSRPLYLVRAPHGTGKTELVLKPLAQLPGCATAITNRVSLVADLCNRLKLSNYQTIRPRDIETVDALGLCLPSIVNPKFGDVLSRADSVLVDEVGACWRELHSLGGTLKKTGPEAVKRLVAMLNQATVAVGVDADLSTQDVLSMAGLVRRPVVVVDMTAKPHSGRVTFADADRVKGAILQAVGNGQKVRVACDSSRTAIELSAIIRAQNPDKKMVCIHSRGGDSTAGDSEVLALLRDVNSGIADIDVLVHSPTVESGVSITVKHFDRTFGLFGGRSVSPSAFIQMLKRDRTAELFEIGLAGNCRQWLETRPRAILNNLEATHKKNVELIGDVWAMSGPVHIEPATAFDARVVDYLATRNVDLNDAGQNLLLLMEARGYQVERNDGLPKISPEEKQDARKLADADYSDAVLNAAPIDSERRAELDNKYQLNPLETAEVERYDAATANGLEPADLTAADLRLYEHGALTKWNRRWDLLHATETAGLANDVSDADFVEPLTLRRHELALAEAYRTLFEVVGFDRVTGAGEVTADSALEAWRNLQSAPCRAVLEHSGLCRFDRVPKYPVRWIGDALKKFGLALDGDGTGKPGDLRRYQILRDVLTTTDGLTVKAAGWEAMTRFAQMRDEKKKDYRVPSAQTADVRRSGCAA